MNQEIAGEGGSVPARAASSLARVAWAVSSTALLAAAVASSITPPCALAAVDRAIKSVGADLGPDRAPDADILFLVSGDNRPTGRGAPPPRVTRVIFSEIGLIRPDFVLWTGDIMYGYFETPEEQSREIAAFLDMARSSRTALFNTPGNHDIHRIGPAPCTERASEEEFVRVFGNLYGSFDYAGAHFIALDTEVICEDDRIGSAQLEWLEKDLEANKHARAIFIFEHKPMFSSPDIDEDIAKNHGGVANARELHELFKRYPVKAVFAGHEHLYWREPADAHDGIEYITAGGAGAPVYATPDRGGIAHYVMVRLTGGKVTYDVIEPGRLFAEPASRPKRNEAGYWVVNSNDIAIPVRGLKVEVPASLAPCSRLSAVTELKARDGTPIPVPVSISSCTTVRSKRTLQLSLTAPRRASVPVTIRRSE